MIIERHHSDVKAHYQNFVPTLQAAMGEGGNNIPMIVQKECK